MSPYILLLDQISWRVGNMYSSNCGCGYDICARGDRHVGRLDVRTPANFLGLEPENKLPD